MNADGSGQVNLTSENPGLDAEAAWAPDGRTVALLSDYNTDTGQEEVQLMDASGENFRQLTHTASGEISDFPQFSPDGTKIAFTRYSLDSDASAIYLMDADGGNEVRITPEWMSAGVPDYSPDGSRIVFFDEFCECPASDIWTVNPDGTSLTRLTNTPTDHEFRPGFSPDGKKLTFSNIPITAEHPLGDLPADIFTMTAKGTGRTNLTNTPDLQERASDWGPRTKG
jgi:TolB protein